MLIESWKLVNMCRENWISLSGAAEGLQLTPILRLDGERVKTGIRRILKEQSMCKEDIRLGKKKKE